MSDKAKFETKDVPNQGEENPDESLQIERPVDLESHFANLVIVTSSVEEVILEFGVRDPGNWKKVQVFRRVALTPRCARRLQETLENNLAGQRERMRTLIEEQSSETEETEPSSEAAEGSPTASEEETDESSE